MPYPVAEELVRRWSRPGDLVLDPFMGSGTTIRAAASNGRSALGIDLNPLASLIARVGLNTTDAGSDVAIYNAARISVVEAISDTVLYPADRWRDRIDTWFLPEAQYGLARLAAAIKHVSPKGHILDFILLAFSRTVRRSSLARPGELKLWRRRFASSPEDPVDIFFREAAHLHWSLVALHAHSPINPDVRVSIVTADAENALDAVPSADLVLTSPPYGDAWTTVAYGNFSLLNRIWLSSVDETFAELSPATEDARALGGSSRFRAEDFDVDLLEISAALSRAHTLVTERSSERARQLLLFCQDMFSLLRKLVRTASPDGRIVLVLGPRRVSGTWVDTGWILGEMLDHLGCHREDRQKRRITGKRLPSRTLQGPAGLANTINEETIDIFKVTSRVVPTPSPHRFLEISPKGRN